MYIRYFIKIFLLTGVSVLISCNKNQDESDFRLTYPDYFPDPQYSFGNNVLTKEGFELGRALFHDPILSYDNTISCASCHSQAHAFADHNIKFSIGIDGKTGSRNSPAMFNLAWQSSFMWDGGINHIEIMPLAPITDTTEMGETLNNVIQKLHTHPYYQEKFKKVFGEKPIDSQKLFYALAQYMSMLVSDDSKYDKYRKGSENFTVDEEDGLIIFRKKCVSCHTEPLFTDFSFRNNGLVPLTNDLGKGRITLDKSDYYKFKVPSLRNIMLTYPYMHDGRFRTIDQVLDHYSEGIVFHENLDTSLIYIDKPGIPLTEIDKAKLKAFLVTLTDYKYISNPLFSQ
ncbi:MAG: cytochrome-c peroxidase [Saprospiraceae bacterium]|nr:cytochrome-c peroxidase [Saprospiraceae bacterium]